MMYRLLRNLFKIAWKAAVGLFDVGGYDDLTEQDLADANTAQARRIAQVSASPADRGLARALLRVADLPPGMIEISRTWTPFDPSTPVVVSTIQHVVKRQGRLRPRTTSRTLLELSRYRNEQAAGEEISAASRRILADGRRLRPLDGIGEQDIAAYEWSRYENGRIAERVLQLRLQRGTAVAIMLAQTNQPEARWDSEVRTMMRIVGERLR